MKTVNQSMRKKDAMQLVTGQPVYMDDVIPQDCLIVKLLRSPCQRYRAGDRHEPCPAGAGHRGDLHMEGCGPAGPPLYPGWPDLSGTKPPRPVGHRPPCPLCGDVVAILAGKDEKCVDKAMKLIKVRYEVLPAVLDYHTALDNPSLSTRRKTGSRWHRSGPTTSATSAPTMRAGRAILRRCWRGAMWSSTIHTTPAPASRP